MKAVELKSSIMLDLETMNEDLLETVARYVRKLTKSTHSRQVATPYKMHLSDKVKRLSGRFAIPADVDINALAADYLMEKHVGR